jgi:Flp pilus assembly CpaF family ATPase
VTTQQLLEASFAVAGPDHLGEIRGAECVSYWSAINSHPGSLTSIPPTPRSLPSRNSSCSACRQLGFTREHIIDYLKHTVDVFVQLRLDPANRRFLSALWQVS